MTNPNKTHITAVIDRSGSMQAVRSDAEGALNGFVDSQRDGPGECTLALYDFDAPEGQRDWFRKVYDGNVNDAPPYELMPRGWTALHDAVAKAIIDTSSRLAAVPEDERPGRVIFVIQTDGQENSSREHDLAKVTELIKHHINQFSWDFIYLGMGADTWGTGAAYGTQSVMRTKGTADSYNTAYAVMGQTVSTARAGGQSFDHTATDVELDDEGNVKA